MKIINLIILIFIVSLKTFSQNPAELLLKCSGKFDRVKSFKCHTHIDFDIPSINIDSMSGKAFYKSPDKFRIKFSGIAFLPKENPFGIFQTMKDSSRYVAVTTGNEVVRGENCAIVTLIPKSDENLISAKFWIGSQSLCPLQMQITTKENGTIWIENFYGKFASNALPDKSIFHIDMKKFKVPKMIAADMNSKRKESNTPEKTEGKVIFSFQNYEINASFSDDVFGKP